MLMYKNTTIRISQKKKAFPCKGYVRKTATPPRHEKQSCLAVRCVPTLPTCLQVQRDPRLVDVRRVTLGADPPNRSAVHILVWGRRHVRPAGQRPLASGATARDAAPQQQQPVVHPLGQTVWEGEGYCNVREGRGLDETVRVFFSCRLQMLQFHHME